MVDIGTKILRKLGVDVFFLAVRLQVMSGAEFLLDSKKLAEAL